jgi:hypothetical protein
MKASPKDIPRKPKTPKKGKKLLKYKKPYKKKPGDAQGCIPTPTETQT